jgi:hypothetical protein
MSLQITLICDWLRCHTTLKFTLQQFLNPTNELQKSSQTAETYVSIPVLFHHSDKAEVVKQRAPQGLCSMEIVEDLIPVIPNGCEMYHYFQGIM